jgi:hypothetical protein
MFLSEIATLTCWHRIEPAHLSTSAIRTFIAAGTFDAEEVRRKTSGNPFFVNEVLANAAGGIPWTIRDAVLERVAQPSYPETSSEFRWRRWLNMLNFRASLTPLFVLG